MTKKEWSGAVLSSPGRIGFRDAGDGRRFGQPGGVGDRLSGIRSRSVHGAALVRQGVQMADEVTCDLVEESPRDQLVAAVEIPNDLGAGVAQAPVDDAPALGVVVVPPRGVGVVIALPGRGVSRALIAVVRPGEVGDGAAHNLQDRRRACLAQVLEAHCRGGARRRRQGEV